MDIQGCRTHPPGCARARVPAHGDVQGRMGSGRRDRTLREDAGRVRKGSGPQVMARLRSLINEWCFFAGKASSAAANRHGHGPPRELDETSLYTQSENE